MTGSNEPVRDICVARVRGLIRCLELDQREAETVAVFRAMTESWGGATLADLPHSDVSADGSPVEFAVNLDERDPTVQIAVEPLYPGRTRAARSMAARRTMSRLVSGYGACEDRWAAVADLYLRDDPAAPYVCMYGVEVRRHGPPGFKVWFYPTVAGPHHDPELLRHGLQRLGLQAAWSAVTRHAKRGFDKDRPILFSLDLAEGPSARTKVYFRHYDIDPGRMAELLARYPGFHSEEVVAFCREMSGDTEGFAVQPPVTCLSFTTVHDAEADATTLYVPLWACAPNDEVIRRRVHRVLRTQGRSPERYDRALARVADRPPAAARGIHNYLSWQPGALRPRMKVYWSPELRHRDPPPRYRLHQLGPTGSAHL